MENLKKLKEFKEEIEAENSPCEGCYYTSILNTRKCKKCIRNLFHDRNSRDYYKKEFEIKLH